MSAASSALSEDQFLCSICQDVFSHPVTTPCGHNFCKKCITEHWSINVLCQCPNCNRVFNRRPDLKVNTFISEMAAQFRQAAQQKASSSSTEQQAAKPGEVPCDVCTGAKLKALKSCLVCLASYCQTHLEPHLKMSHLKKHQLKQLEETISEQMKTLIELKRVQQYEVDVTLDPDTAHASLVLSDDGKQVYFGKKFNKKLPDTPERFYPLANVLSKQSFSSGRFYYEVQVEGKTTWTLGVARESVNRKENCTVYPEDGFWTIWVLTDNECTAVL